jgi:hypothetical protein
MIFKKLFRPKYQDPNPRVRIQAIDGLDPTQSEHKSLLHELAFNDEDAGVNLAALTHLKSFALWCKMAHIANTERVRKKAQLIVEDTLFERSELSLSEQERVRFVKECKNIALLEKLLNLPWLKNNPSGLLLQVLDKINKSHIEQQLFLQSEVEAVQLSLLERINDEGTLNKSIKKTPFQSVKQQAQQKLNAIAESKTRPIEIEKQSKLVLSRLLALKDKSDFVYIQQTQQELNNQFSTLSSEFSCLKQDISDSLLERQQQINKRVNTLLEQLAPEWQSQQAQIELNKQITACQANIEQDISVATSLMAKNADQLDLAMAEQLTKQLQQHCHKLDELRDAIDDNNASLLLTVKRLFKAVSDSIDMLTRLPEFHLAVQQAIVLLNSVNALPLPTDASQIEASQSYIKDQKIQWQQLRASFQSIWPAELESNWQQFNQRWQKATRQLKDDVKQSENRCRSKLKAIDSLIKQGKFKVAMSMYTRVESWYQALPEHSQGFLQRNFDSVKEQIENLKDLQHYIAQPRKPALLTAVEELIQSPREIDRQAEEVKRLRSEWNSLGNSGTEADDALNQAFEVALEQAFEPCRQYFAKQQQERLENLEQKRIIISKLTNLAGAEIEESELAVSLADLQKQWRKIGKVDYRELDQLNKQYQDAILPIKHKVDAYYQAQAEQKQLLLTKATKLLESDDVMIAVEQAKLLQQQWKLSGYAGPKLDQTLWHEFRKVNDQIFAKRKLQMDEMGQATQQQVDNLQSQLAVVTEALDGADSLSQFESVKQSILQLKEDAEQIDSPTVKALARQIVDLDKKYAARQQQLRQQQQNMEIQQLFQALENSIDSGFDENVLQHLGAYKQALKQTEQPEYSRAELNVLLDILAEQPSSKAELKNRSELQLKLMSAKLQHGETLNKQDLLSMWIQHGAVNSDEKPLLDRLQAHFIG